MSDRLLIGKVTYPVWDKDHREAVTDEIYWSEDKGFTILDGSPCPVKDMENLAVCINSPWSQANECYTIEVNCKDGYTEIKNRDLLWRCLYEVVGYEMITSVLYGYGPTVEEALADCKRRFEVIQKQYNPEDDSF